jgi:hypothetical protein
MERGDTTIRTQLVDVLGGIPGPEAARVLTVVSIVDDSAGVRERAVDQLRDRKADRQVSLAVLNEGLESRRLGLITAAADAAAELDEKRAIPGLINALITPVRTDLATEVLIPGPFVAPVPTTILTVTEEKRKHELPPGVTRPQPAESRPQPAETRAQPSSSYAQPSATTLPVPAARSSELQDGGFGLRSTTNPPPLRGPRYLALPAAYSSSEIRTVVSPYQNDAVLESLRRLSGEDYGFDQRAWQRWWNTRGRRLADEANTLEAREPPPDKPAPLDAEPAQQGSSGPRGRVLPE